MSVAEMKLEAIKQISSLADDATLKQILEILHKHKEEEDIKTLDLARHYQNIKAKYGDVLAKLAQ